MPCRGTRQQAASEIRLSSSSQLATSPTTSGDNERNVDIAYVNVASKFLSISVIMSHIPEFEYSD